MGVSKTSDHIQIKIKMPNPSQEPPASSKAPNEYLDFRTLQDYKLFWSKLICVKIEFESWTSLSWLFRAKLIWVNIEFESWASLSWLFWAKINWVKIEFESWAFLSLSQLIWAILSRSQLSWACLSKSLGRGWHSMLKWLVIYLLNKLALCS